MTSPSRGTGGPGRSGPALLLRYWVPLLAYVAVIFSGSSVHGDAIPALFPNMDKVAHLLEYSVLGLLIGRALRATFPDWSPIIFTFATVGLGGMIGLADELYQGHYERNYLRCPTEDLRSSGGLIIYPGRLRRNL